MYSASGAQDQNDHNTQRDKPSRSQSRKNATPATNPKYSVLLGRVRPMYRYTQCLEESFLMSWFTTAHNERDGNES